MSTALEVVITVIVASLIAVSVSGMAIGIETWLAGERFERCPSCRRYGLTAEGVRHAAGCRHSPMAWRQHPGDPGDGWAPLHLHRP